MELHELIKGTEPVSKRGVLYPFLVGYYEIIKGQKSFNGVDKEMPISRNGANLIAKESEMYDIGKSCQCLYVVPFTDTVIMKVEKL